MSSGEDHAPYEEGDDLVAAEYVLGVLPAQERAAVARRIDSDPRFARLVEGWEKRLSPMADAYEEVEPPPAVRAKLYRRLFAGEADKPRGVAALWQSLALWRTVTALSVAALVAVSVLFFTGLPVPAPQQRFVASLSHEASDVHYLVVYDARSGDVALSHVTGARPEGRDFELWVIEDGAPRSLGVIPAGSAVHMDVANALRSVIDSEAVLAITAEPEGGSPTGQPTGPVVAQGGLNVI